MLLIESYRLEQGGGDGAPRIGPVAVAAGGPEVLFEILRPGVGLAVWGRAPMPGPLDDLARSPALPVFEAVAESAYDRVAGVLLQQAPCTLPDLLRIDIESLAAMFAVVTMASGLRGRLRSLRLERDAPFRPEPARLRLLCAYQGPGIEWLPAPDARPGGLDPFSAAIAKGEAFPGHLGRSHSHRPAAATGAHEGCLLLDLEAA